MKLNIEMYKRPMKRRHGLSQSQLEEYMSRPSEVVAKKNNDEMFKKYVYRPIQNVDSYIRSLRYHNYPEEFIEYVKKMNYIPPPIVHTLDSVKARIIVGKTKVFVRIYVPFEEVRKYFKVGKVPPIEVQLKCLKLNGEYPHVLHKKYKEYQLSKHKKNYTLDDVFKLPFKPVKKIIPSFHPPEHSQPCP